MANRLTEQAAYLAGNGTVDRVNKTITNAKLCGLVSVNGREYDPQALRDAAPKIAGRRVFLNHVDDPKKRRIGEEFARITSCRFVEGDGLRGDLRYYESCQDTPLILEIIEDHHTPGQDGSPYTGSLGLSPVWYADCRQTSGKDRVQKIHDIESVDIVTFPATTRSIRESWETPMTWTKYAEGLEEAPRLSFTRLLEELGAMDSAMPAGDHTEDLLNAIKKLLSSGDHKLAKKIFKLLTAAGVADDEEETPEEEKVMETDDKKQEGCDMDKKQEDAAALLAQERTKNTVLMECVQEGVRVDEETLQAFCDITNSKARTRLIKEQAMLQKKSAPRSQGQGETRYKSQEDLDKDALEASKQRIKNDA